MNSVDDYQHHWYQVGKASALEDLIKMLTARAGDAFGRHQDKEATWYRDLALELQQYAAKAHAEANKGLNVVYPGIQAIDLLLKLRMRGFIDCFHEPPVEPADQRLLEEVKAFLDKQERS